MHQQILKLHAQEDRTLHIWFEPWAEGLAFPAGSTVELHAESQTPGELELDVSEESTTVYGWLGSTLRVIVEGHVVTSFDLPVPSALTREKVSLLFGSPPVPTLEERSLPAKKPWWQLW